jgi:hypothetical protein
MTAITGDASLRALQLLAGSSSPSAKSQSTQAKGNAERLNEADANLFQEKLLAKAKAILDSNDPHNGLNGDTDAIMFDNAGKQIGRVFANGVVMIEDDAIDLFGGANALHSAMSETNGVAARKAKLQAMLGNRGHVVDVAGYEKSRDLLKLAADNDKVDLSDAAREAVQLLGSGEPSAAARMSAAVRAAEDARFEAARQAAAQQAATNRPAPPKQDLTPEQIAERSAYAATLQTLSAQHAAAHDEWIKRFDAVALKLKEAGERLGEASRKVPAFAVIRDAEGKEAGRILQGGGASLDGRLQAMLAMLWADKKGFDGNAHDLFAAIQSKLADGYSIEKTGVEVNMEEILAAEYADLHAAQDELHTLAAEGRAISDGHREAIAAARPGWMNQMRA